MVYALLALGHYWLILRNAPMSYRHLGASVQQAVFVQMVIDLSICSVEIADHKAKSV